MIRTDVVKRIMSDIFEDDIVIASTGFISREVYKYDRPLNFYMMGSMGNALAIGIGLAMHTKHRVVVINGDGSVLMSLGTMLTAKKLNLPNLIHYIIDNDCHESTGGQPTHAHLIDFRHLSRNVIVYSCNKDQSVPPRIDLTPKQLTERFKSALQSLDNK
jgi:thiamine pyrophosphate-dependent acetolactate synthase large subunit-like protein